MSRIIQQIATVQFQVDNRKVTASMNALQTEAESLNGKIAAVNQSIKALGDVPADNKFLLEYQKQLRQLNSDLKDVTTAQRDLMKGVKAADQLWKAAKTQDIESLSIKAIKAGQNGLRKRMDNLRPELGGDEQKMYDAYKAVIDEADRVMNVFKSNYATVVQTIRDGGIVSEQAMKSTRDALRDLMEAEKEGTAEHRQLKQMYDFLNESLANVAEMRRREKGEIVNANDARREALKLTEDGIAAARRERDMADVTIASMQEQKNNLDQQRKLHEDRIAQTEREIAANQRLEEAEQDRLADVEKAMRYTENEDRKEAIRLRKKADAARDEAEAKKEAYEQQAEQEKLLRQHVKDTGDEVTALTAKIEALGKTEAPKNNPVLDGLKHEADVAASAIAQLEERLKQLKSPDSTIKPITVENALADRLGVSEGDLKISRALNGIRSDAFVNGDEATVRAFLRAKGFTGIYDKDSMSDYRSVSKKDMISQLTEYIGNRFSGYDVSDDTYGIASGGKYHDMDWLEEVTEKERQKFVELSYEKQKAWVERVIKKQFGEIDAILYRGADDSSAYVGKGDSALTGLRSVMNAEVWKGGKSEGPVTQAELDAQQKLITTTKELIQQNDELAKTEHQLEVAKKAKLEIDEKIAQAQQQGSKNTVEAIDAEIKKIQEQRRAIEDRREEIAKEQKERDAAYEKEKKRLMGNPAELNEAERKMFAVEQEYTQLGASFKRKKTDFSPEHLSKFESRFGVWEDFFGSGRRSFAKGMEEDELNAYKNQLYDRVQSGNLDRVKEDYETIKRLIKEINAASKDSSIEGNPNLQLDGLKKLKAEYEKVIKAIGDLGERKDDAFFEWLDAEASDAYKRLEDLKKIPDEVRKEMDELDAKDDELTQKYRDARERRREAEKQQATATKESTQADQQSVDVAKQKAELEEKVKEKTKEHTKAVKDFEAQQEKTNKAQEKAYKAQEESVALNEKAATAEEKVAHQEERHAEAMDQQSERIRQIRAEGQRLLDQYEQQKTEIQAVDKAWADADVKQGEAEARKAQNQELTTKSIDDSIRKLKEANAVIDTNSDEWEENTRIIQRLQAALDEMKNKPVLMMMTDRMHDISTLSKDALAETRKFWEQMEAGADRNDPKLKEIEQNLKRITDEERRRKEVQAEKVIGSMGTSSDEEIGKAIQAFEQLRDAQAHGNDEWRYYNERVQEGKKYLEEWAQTDKVIKFEEQMQNLPRLSDAALTETRKFWETMVAGAEKGSSELREYEANLERAKQEERERSEISNEIKAGIVRGESFNVYSLDEIRESIKAAKELQSHMASASPEAVKLAESIAKAEEHVRKYGGEAARTALSNETMRNQFQTMADEMSRGIMPSASAVKAQQNYWKKLIEDPKTAKESLQEYRDQLAEVEKMQEAMVRISGETAYEWFQDGSYKDASTNKVKEMAADLKAYRDTLPQETEADKIKQIDEWLQKTGQSAKKTSDELMSLGEAIEVAGKAGDDIYGKNGPAFMASPEEIQAATKSIEKYREALFKTIKAKRDSGEATDTEEKELKRLAKYLKDLKFEQDNFNMSREKMETLMKTPVSAANLDELRAAIKRADAELRRMEGSLGTNSDKYKELAADVKNAKGILKEMEGQAKATTSAFDKAWSRLKTYVGLYVGASVAMNKLMGTMGDLMDLSDKMGEVRKTTGFTADEVGRLSGELKKFDTRTTLNGLLDLSVAAGQLGLKTEEDVLGFTEAANKLMVALPEMGREGATEMLKVALATGEIDKIRKQMEQGLIDGSSATAVAMEKVGSTIDRLRATSAATAPAITDFVKRVGAVGAQSGISIDQVAALGSTVDALGMRVEMSATALSRMIPAIKNNAYQIGAMIGQTEESIISRFENGQGMDVILDIFQSIRDNSKMMTGDVEADAETIEQAFEGAGLKDVMKELNQQGARAGIVFAGLSQNVDELRKHLDTAADAYEENIAIEMEYMKMNETTAAKWERLKNQIEEFFVSDSAQRFLGGVIDLLRDIVDWLTGNNGIAIVLRTIIAYMAVVKLQLVSIAAGALKAVGGGLKNIGVMLGFIDGKMTKIQWGNVFMAAAAAVWYLVVQLRQLWKDLHATETIISETLASYNSKVAEATQKTEKLFEKVGNARVAMKDATEEVKKAEEALKKTKEAMNAGKASAEDLEKAELNLKVAHEKETQANKDHYDTIRKINQEYSPYLGYMLSEISTAAELANARELINAKLRETILLKQKEAAYSRVESEFGGERDKRQSAAYETIGENVRDPEAAARLRKDLMNIVKQEADKEKMNIVEFRKELNKAMSAAGGDWSVTGWQDFESEAWRLAEQERTIRDAKKRVDEAVAADIKAARTGTESTKGTRQEFEEQLEAIYKGDDGKGNGVKGLAEKYKKAGEKDRKQIAANLLMQMDAYETLLSKSKNFFDLKEEDEEKSYKTFIANSDKRIKGLGLQRDDLLKIAGDAYKPIQDDDKDKGKDKNKGRGPYGNYDKRVDPYEQWDANALVKRREDMLMRVRALAGGADVQKVLSMDKRFMDEATRKGIKNMRDAIAWYNTERLKIQEELDSRNLTNEGQWKDPKKGRSRKPKTPESEEAIAELDRYYLERKERIEEARANEEMTEAEYNRRLDALEQEHLERRSALRQTFTSKDKQFIQQFRQWWASVEELDEVSWETIEAEWIAAFDRDRKYNDRAAQKDLTQMQAIVVKQLREIESIIDKERPFNGITRNLQDNLTKMGLLFKDGVPEGDKFMQENTHRLTFLLKEAEDAYNMTFDQLAEDMRKNGLGAWADAIINSENAEKEKRAVIAQLHEVYDAVQEAIKKEASLVKKQVDITWNDALLPNGKSIKATYEAAISQLGVQQNSVSRANSLIGAGVASERVADRLALRQMRLQLQMQEHYFNLVRQTGMQRIADLKEQARLKREQGKIDEAEQLDLDAKHATMSLNLSLAKEETELAKQREEIIARTEESQNRLYTSLKEWADLLTSSLQGLFEASHAGDAEYYNELAKLNLTGKGGPGAGTYVVIDDAGTSDAKANYEYLDERAALEREREIERENAMADAWKKVWDDLNAKMSEQITDWMNAALQNHSIDMNTDATLQNTEALAVLTSAIAGGSNGIAAYGTGGTAGAGGAGGTGGAVVQNEALSPEGVQEWTDALGTEPWLVWEQAGRSAMQDVQKATVDAGKKMTASTQSSFAKMTAAANLYGIAYQTMSNDNLSASQKAQMIAVQAAGNAAIAMLTTDLAAGQAKNSVQLPGILGKLLGEMPYPAAIATFAVVTGLLGGLMGLAVSKIAKSKSEIAQATGAAGANAGKLTTGMLTYAEGNVNEFTDPASLTPGRSYNVDAADGKTYRARYMGRSPKTHLTSGPEFHLSGEKGREMIIDAGTTRQITMNESEVWHAIQTLSVGGRVRHGSAMRRRGVRAFADGNVEEFEDMGSDGIAAYGTGGGMSPEQMAAFQSSLDRNNELLDRALREGIRGVFDVHGSHGLVNTYDTAKKEALRHGERYT